MNIYFRLFLLALAVSLILPRLSFGIGENSPTGPAGDYSGAVTTAGSIDPYTGNARRIVDDIVVTGGLGAYPLKWSRIHNTRSSAYGGFGHGGSWSHSYNWGLTVLRPEPPTTIPPYEGPDGWISLPDGRQILLRAESGTFVIDNLGEPAGSLQEIGDGNFDFTLVDGGRVEFRHPPGSTSGHDLLAKAIVDPFGQRTTLEHDSNGRLHRIIEPGQRFLKINYRTINWTWNSQPRSVVVIDNVQAFSRADVLVETVSYSYTPAVVGSWGIIYQHLTGVNYADGTAAYTYQTSNIPEHLSTMYRDVLSTCNDVRFAGPMKMIKYEYEPATPGIVNGNVAWGQVKAEKNMTTGQTITEVIYPAFSYPPDPQTNLKRTEKRADGATRLFDYGGTTGSGLASYTDFGKPGPGPNTSRIHYEAGPTGHYFKVFTDARTNRTMVLKENVAGAVVSVKRGNGQAATYHYTDPANPYYLDHKTDERGKITQYHRDTAHRIWRTEYPDGGWEEFTYNDFGQVVTHKRTNGEHIAYDHFEYDGRGRLLTRWDPTPSGEYPPSGPVPYSSFTYYESGPWTDRVHRARDQRGFFTEYQYDARGNVTRLTHPDGSYTQSFYNPDGTLAWSADENHPGAGTDVNQRTRYVYDEYKRVTEVRNPENQPTTNSYDPLNNLGPLSHTTSSVYRTTSAMLKHTDYTYDWNFRRHETIQAPGTDDQATTRFFYDAAGNLHQTEDPRGHITTFEYDDRNRQYSVTHLVNGVNETTTVGYDDANNKTMETRHDGSFRTWDHDEMNRVWHANGWRMPGQPAPTTIYDYDIAGNVRSITDAKGAIYGYNYDLKNLKISETYPEDATHTIRMNTYAYDEAGNLFYVHKLPSGQKKQIHFDSRNRPDHSWHFDGGVAGPDIVTVYDDASRVESIVTNNGETTIAFGYDHANRKLWEDQTVAGAPGEPPITRRVKTDPDADGKRMNLEVIGPGGEGPVFSPEMQGSGVFFVGYQYTERNQLKRMDSDGWTFKYEYDGSGNTTTKKTEYNSILTSTSCPTGDYDALNRPATWEQSGPGGFHALSHYQYDHVNREVATWRDEEGSLGERFTYEPTNQLATAVYKAQQVWTTNPLNAERSVSYTYTPDKLNRSSMTDNSANGGVPNYPISALNQYMSTGASSYSYDSNFNLTHAPGFNGVYDAASRLVAASNGGSGEAGQTIAGFVYDGLGRCVKRIFNGVVTVLVYDGWKPVAEFDGWGYFQAWNLYGPGADEILLRHKDKIGYLRFHSDRHGNVAFILNENGAVLEKYKYDAFGQPTVTDGNGANARSWSYYEHCFLFQGREYIREFGIYDYRNRFYLPALGRFVQSDPIGFSAGDMNLFRYVNDDPVNGSDPTGLYSPLTMLGGGDWIKGSDGLSAWDRDHGMPSNRPQAGMDGGGGGDAAGTSKSMSPQNEGKKQLNNQQTAPPLRFVPKPEKTEDNRYYQYAYYQLTSQGKPVPGYDYFAQELTTVHTNNFTGVTGGKVEVQTTDQNRLSELPRSGLFKDRIGLGWQPSSRVSGTLILDQRFDLKYRGQDVQVSTVLRHVTAVTSGQVRNSVIVITP